MPCNNNNNRNNNNGNGSMSRHFFKELSNLSDILLFLFDNVFFLFSDTNAKELLHEQ